MTTVEFNNLIENGSNNATFSYDKIWNDPDLISVKYRLFLSPDSRAYYSRLNPIFSFELKEANLRYFSLLSLRDGVYPLLRFFAMNECPHVADCSLIVDASLASIIPEKWKGKVFLRELYVKNPLVNKERNECILLISPDKDSLPLDIFRKEIEKNKENLRMFKKLSIYFSSCISRGEEEAQYNSNWGYSLLADLFRVLKDFNGEIEILDWNQYQKKNVSNSHYLFINPLRFYFSDSYLQHDLLQKGALPLLANYENKPHVYKEALSAHHGYYISLWDGGNGLHCEDDCKKHFKNQNTDIKAFSDNFYSVKLSDANFKDFSADIARKIYNT